MAVSKTTKNSKLPVVSKIAFCASAGKGMATKIYTGENGVFTKMVGFKQNSTTYPFQVQYRQRSRYTYANQKIKGATWTNWCRWKNAKGVSGIPFDGTDLDYPVDTWLKANVGVNKNGTYQTFFTFNQYQIPATYDAREFQFRIRTINRSQAKHGTWTVQTLQVFKRAHIVDESIITTSDGGFKVKFNYIWDRNANIQVNSILDSEERELLKKPFTVGVSRAQLNDSSVPPSRTGYLGGQVIVNVSKLKRKVTVGETLTLDIRFTTGDGAPTKLASGTVLEPTRDIGMTVTQTWEQNRGLLIVNVTNADNYVLADIGCNITYTYNGKTYSIAPFVSNKNLARNGLSKFYFYPPIGIPVSLHIKEEDVYDYKDTEDVTSFTLNAKGYRLNKVNSTSICGVGWGNPSYEINSAPQFETDLPYGRNKNIIFYGQGYTNNISFTATIVDKANCYGGFYGRKAAWDKVSNNQGLYYFRTNKGDMYLVGLTNVVIHHQNKDLYEISATMVEVV